MVILMLVAASMYGCLVMSYLYLWTVSPQVWPETMPPAWWPALAAGLFVASSAVVAFANRGVRRNGNCLALLGALPLQVAAVVVAFVAQRDVSPRESSYGAIEYAIHSVDAFFVAVCVVLAGLAVARRLAGRLDAARRVSFDNARLFWHYTVAQALVGLALVHGFPRLVG
jgi:heme/copper-type cytochrome/quinol oxidase subunit 3